MSATILRGDARDLPLSDNSVDLIVTSPPYFGLRSYLDDGRQYATQIGVEPTPKDFVAALVACTREMRRIIKPTGSIFVNLGDKWSTYESRPGNAANHSWAGKSQAATRYTRNAPAVYGIPFKSLMLLPWRFAIACVDELGLIVRQELIWSKGSAMPTRITDRTRRTHEVFLHLTKAEKYYADLDAIRENDAPPGSVRSIGVGRVDLPARLGVEHNAVFPVDWPRWLINGWCPPGGVVADVFGGSGTTALVADVMGRAGISIDASADYCRAASWRVADSKERARARGLDPSSVAAIKPEIAGQESLLDLLGDAS